jgi:hypothetical protein
MSISWTPGRRDPRPNRGGAPVGHIAELPPLERLAVLHLRQWCSGPEERETIALNFSRVFSPAAAAQEVNTLAALMDYLIAGQRRPVMRHDLACTCFGGDESAFAHMVAAATAGDREDAMAFALTLMRPDAAWQAVMAAEGVGLALLRLSRVFAAAPFDTPAKPAPRTHH